MTDNKKVPRLRFKEFTDAWEQRKLGCLMNITSVKRIHQSDWRKKGIPFYRARDITALSKNLNIEEPIFISRDLYEEYSKISGKVQINDLLVTGVGTIGVPLLVQTVPLYFKDGNIIWFQNSNKLIGLFFLYLFKTNTVQKYIHTTTGVGTVPTYTIQSGKNTPVYITSKKEQKDIGTIFQLIDNLISLHQRKLNLLNQLKKGMLQKLFAGKNQKQPNLRFKGFADTWKKETLKEVSQWSKGQGLPRKDLNAYEKGKEVIHYADLYKLGPVIKGVIHWSTSKEGRKIPTNSIIFPMSDVTPTGLARTSAVVKDGILAGGDVLIDNLSSKIQSKFLSYEINANSHQILSLVTGTTVKHINSKSLNRLSITYPNMQEQEMISNTLENIFTQIEFYRYRISKLQQLKKSLLQNMFI